jgi:abhydrolase domain-containing protein 6
VHRGQVQAFAHTFREAAPKGGLGIWWLFPRSPALAGNAAIRQIRERMEQSELSILLYGQKHNINYWHGGSGTAIILLQGGMANAELHWNLIWEHLSSKHRVVAPDLPGFGKSTPFKNMNWQTLSEWLKAFLDTLEVKNAVIIGNSFGGTFARAFAGYYPTYVSHLILLDGGGYIRLGFLQRIFLASPIGKFFIDKQQKAGISKESLEKMMPNIHLLDKQQQDKWLVGSGIIYQIGRDCILGSTPLDVNSLPTLIIWGNKDMHSPLKRAQSLKGELSSAKLVVLNESGHLPQLDQPDDLVKILNEFIA